MANSKFLRKFQSLLIKLVSRKSINVSDPIKSVLIVFQPKFQYELFLLKYLIVSIKQKYSDIQITLSLPSKFIPCGNFIVTNRLCGFSESDKVKPFLSNWFAVNYDLILVPSISTFSFFPHLIMSLSRASSKTCMSDIKGIANPFGIDFAQSDQRGLTISSDQFLGEWICNKLNIPFIIEKNNSFANKEDYILVINNPEEQTAKLGKANVEQIITMLEDNFKSPIKIIDNKFSGNKNNIDIIEETDNQKKFDLIKKSRLIITSDLLSMYLASEVNTNLVAIFLDKNGFNYSPPGENIHFIQPQSELLNEISTEEILSKVKLLLKRH